MAVNGMVKRLCKEVGYVDLWDSFVGKGLPFLPRDCRVAVASGLGKFNGAGGVCQRRLKKYKRIADAKEYRETHPKQKLNACA